MALSKNQEVGLVLGFDPRIIPVKTGVHIFKGSFVGMSAGYARPLAATDTYVGIAYDEVDNTLGGNGALNIRVMRNSDFQYNVTGASITSIGAFVYATDDCTLTVTASTNTLVGVIVSWVSGTTCVISQVTSVGSTAALAPAASVVTLAGIEAITGKKTFGSTKLAMVDGDGDVATVAVASLAASRTYTLPDALANCNFILGNKSVAGVTATVAGATTGVIPDSGGFVFATVVGVTGQAGYLITLPTPTPGTILILSASAFAYKLQSSAPSTVLINGGVGGASVSSAITAGLSCVLICDSATSWKGFTIAAAGTLAAIAPAS